LKLLLFSIVDAEAALGAYKEKIAANGGGPLIT